MTAAGRDKSLPRLDEVGQNFAVGPLHDRPDGNVEHPVFAVAPRPHVAGPGRPGGGLLMGGVMVCEKGGLLGIGFDDDIASPPSVCAVGSAQGLEFLSTHRNASVSAVTRLDVKRHMIDEAGHLPLLCKGPCEKGAEGRAFHPYLLDCFQASAATMSMTLRSRRVPNLT